MHEIKVDRSFVQGMATVPGDLAIVREIVDVSRHFGLSVVAQGIESELIFELLEEIECEVGRGILFGGALPFGRLNQWLAETPSSDPTSRDGFAMRAARCRGHRIEERYEFPAVTA